MTYPEVAINRSGAMRWLPAAAIAGPVLFDVAALVLGFLRPGYSGVSRPISMLAAGADGGVMRAAFILYGPLVAVGVTAALGTTRRELGATRRWVCTGLLVLPALAVTWAGIYTMDPPTLMLHTLGAQVAFAFPVIAFPIVGVQLRRVPHFRRLGGWLILGAPMTVALLVGFMFSVPFTQMATGGGALGLWQRALLIEVQFWFAALGFLALHKGVAAR